MANPHDDAPEVAPDLLDNPDGGQVYATGTVVQQEHGVVIAGVSLGNRYYRNTERLVRFLLTLGYAVNVFIPTQPYVHTLRALGWTVGDAVRKVRLDGNRLVRQALAGATDVDAEHPDEHPLYHLVDWEGEVAEAQPYQAALNAIRDLYNNNEVFAAAVRDTTNTVLNKNPKKEESQGIEIGINVGKDFLLEELAFLWAAHPVLGIDAETSISYVYHEPWPIFERFVNGEFFGGDGEPQALVEAGITVQHLGITVYHYPEDA